MSLEALRHTAVTLAVPLKYSGAVNYPSFSALSKLSTFVSYIALTHEHTNTHPRTHMHTHTHTHASTHARTHVHTHTHIHIHTHTHTHTHTHDHVLMSFPLVHSCTSIKIRTCGSSHFVSRIAVQLRQLLRLCCEAGNLHTDRQAVYMSSALMRTEYRSRM